MFFIGWPLTLSLQLYEQCPHLWTSNWRTFISMGILILKRFNVQHLVKYKQSRDCKLVYMSDPKYSWTFVSHEHDNSITIHINLQSNQSWVCFPSCECFRMKNDNLSMKILWWFSLMFKVNIYMAYFCILMQIIYSIQNHFMNFCTLIVNEEYNYMYLYNDKVINY